MEAEKLIKIIGLDFYTGVPDSLLTPLCDCLVDKFGMNPSHHIVAANEGNCAALAAGYYLATGKIPVVYLQNSGEGNIVNPAASLLHKDVYGIPMVFLVGWRGRPGGYDEPQHIFQGKITLKLLENMGIKTFVVEADTTDSQMRKIMEDFRAVLEAGRQVAFVICRNAISYHKKIKYQNNYSVTREEIIRNVVDISGNDIVVCTTGKAGRELFEIREKNGQGHQYDFLSVGSMGHASSIALGIAVNQPERRVWCIDGDGAVLMHMGAMAVIGTTGPKNLIHIVVNNGAHETVGGLPTAANRIEIAEIAKACGYSYTVCVQDTKSLIQELEIVVGRGCLSMIEVKCALGSRIELGRPTTTPQENKKAFMEYIRL